MREYGFRGLVVMRALALRSSAVKCIRLIGV